MHFTSSVPGKALLAGGYAILSPLGRGIVLALDSYFHCKLNVSKSDKSRIRVDSSQIDQSWEYCWERGALSPEGMNPFIEATLDHFAKEKGLFQLSRQMNISFQFERQFASPFSEVAIKNQKIALYSKDYVKSGLGSSACLIVSLSKCLCQLLSLDLSPQEQFDLADKINKKAQGGVGSSFDIASSIFKSHIFQREVNPIPLKIDKNIRVNLIFGKKSSNSRVLSSKVKQYLCANPIFQLNFIHKNNQIVQTLLKALHNHDLLLLRAIHKDHLALLQQLTHLTSQPILSSARALLFNKLLSNSQVLYAIAPGAGGDDAFVVLTTGECQSQLERELGGEWAVRSCRWA